VSPFGVSAVFLGQIGAGHFERRCFVLGAIDLADVREHPLPARHTEHVEFDITIAKADAKTKLPRQIAWSDAMISATSTGSGAQGNRRGI